ncbi:Pycsar system effector family protein [Sphingobium subterraneum]|uniref:Pycsar effector protein domain-containing protein n=1 Tax=Sphingobium subterraneum TaxID=627688 RepID=A0A841J1P8_9SPHN|nr:Pycsar system effector family protein [Sphingobium subterraneum]MBB6124272.1 hypothetical protein [Sphingobium subterraneum]
MTDEQSKNAPDRSFPPNAVHLVRTVLQGNLTLSQMADQKANMVMGAAFVVFTLSVGQVRSGGGMLLPITLLASGALVAAVCAILAVLPKVAQGKGDVDDDANLLFFGVFTHLSEAEFIDRVLDRLVSDEAAYRTMLRDIYQNGQVLARKKYRFLGYAYRAFLAGLILAFVAFAGELAVGVTV